MNKHAAKIQLVALVSALLFAFFIGSAPRPVPPGNEWTRMDWLALIALPLSAILGGAYCRALYPMFLYGCAGGLAFMPLLLPDSRDYLVIGRHYERLWADFTRIGVLIPVMGLVCMLGAWTSRLIWRRREPDWHCHSCGYLLYGLQDGRCPECGTPFDGRPPATPPA